MRKFEFIESQIPGCFEIRAFFADDMRGRFVKEYNREAFEEHGIRDDLKEVFYSTNKKGVLRGLHFQRGKMQSKLVSCISGHVWDVVVDLRRDSPTFKQWQAFDLTGEECNQVYVPIGCAHGFLTLEDAVVLYLCGEVFYPEGDGGIRWDSPDIGVKWPLEKLGTECQVILSAKDKQLPSNVETHKCILM